MNVISGLYHCFQYSWVRYLKSWLINICCAHSLNLQLTEKKAPKSEMKKRNSVPIIHTT